MTMVAVFLIMSAMNLAQWRFGNSWRARLASGIPGVTAIFLVWKARLPDIEPLWPFLVTFVIWFVTTLLVLRSLPETAAPPHRVARWQD